MRHLLHIGHKEIALINGPLEMDVSKERLAGFKEALLSARLSPLASYLVQGDFKQAGGFSAMKQLLGLQKPPKAVLISNNLMTFGRFASHSRSRIADTG